MVERPFRIRKASGSIPDISTKPFAFSRINVDQFLHLGFYFLFFFEHTSECHTARGSAESGRSNVAAGSNQAGKLVTHLRLRCLHLKGKTHIVNYMMKY